MHQTRWRVLDLFAGAGGLSEGFSRGNRRFMATHAVEMDPDACATYSANHAAEVFCGQIQDWLEEQPTPEVEVVLGGPPCQGFSTLGRMDVLDERNGLWRHYADALRRVQPSYFIMENVPAFLASHEFHGFNQLTRSGSLGPYQIKAEVLNAADYGAPQARKRAIVIGWRTDVPEPNFPQKSHEPDCWVSVRTALEGVSPEVSAIDLPPRESMFRGERLQGPFRSDELHVTRSFRQLSVDRFHAIPEGGNRFDLPDDLLAPCWKKHKSGSGDVMGRLRWDAPSVTIRTEFFKPEKGRYIHPTEHRAITHFEAARIQGFRDDYLWFGSKTSIARQIGNAVPVALGEALGRAISAAFNSTRQSATQDDLLTLRH